jgi:hypothetical protein
MTLYHYMIVGDNEVCSSAFRRSGLAILKRRLKAELQTIFKGDSIYALFRDADQTDERRPDTSRNRGDAHA